MNFEKKRLLVVGHVAKDIVYTNSGNNIYWGGGAYHTALAASQYLERNRVTIVSKVGRDFDFLAMTRAGIDVSSMVTMFQVNTDCHWLDERGEERKYRTEGNLGDSVSLKDCKLEKEEIGWIHLASASPNVQGRWLNEIVEMGWNDIGRSCDTFETYATENPKEVGKVMRRCDLGFANEVEYGALANIILAPIMVAKRGPRGAEFYHRSKLVFRVGTREIFAKDTTGAGDVAAGVYLAMRLRGVGDEDSLTEACKAATKSIEEFGTTHLLGSVGFSDNLPV